MDTKEFNELYPKAERGLASQIKKLQDSGIITENKTSILDFLEHCRARQLSTLRILTYAYRLRILAELMGDVSFREAERQDFERLMRQLAGRNYKQGTQNTTIVMLKAFMRWLNGCEKNDPTPRCVSWIERTDKLGSRIRAEQLLTEGEIEAIILAIPDTKHASMNQAIIATMYEGALRPEELRSMKIKDVHAKNGMFKIYVRGKMEKSEGDRVAVVVRAFPLLKRWLSEHPDPNNDDAWLWTINGGGEPVNHQWLKKMLERTARRAQLKKRVFPYLYRHSRATQLYRALPAAKARQILGHSARMEKTYAHLAEEDIEDSALEFYGQKPQKRHQSSNCIRCGSLLSFGQQYCIKCGLPENTRAAYKREVEVELRDGIMLQVMKDPVIRHRITEMRQELLKAFEKLKS